ncbi:MAG: hypothetical protein ACK5NB_08775 [Flavobacteriaceae bacterium]
MKKAIILILTVCLTVVSCKNENKTNGTDTTTAQDSVTNNDGTGILKGSFVLYDGAAVFQTENEIYGVLLTDKAYELNKQAEQYKALPTDMVHAEVKGTISTQSHEKIHWPKKLEITEILHVSPEKN